MAQAGGLLWDGGRRHDSMSFANTGAVDGAPRFRVLGVL
jgi:hypothetical protein